MRVTKWTGILGFVVILLASPLAVAAQVPVMAPRAVASPPLALVPAPGSPFFVGQYPDTVLTGDLNRDGKLDLVVGTRSTGRGTVYFGGGNGSFVAPPVPLVTLGYEADLTDVSSDGILDLVLACNGGMNVQRGRGDGTFVSIGVPADEGCGSPFALVDIDRDGVRDVVVSGYCTGGKLYRGRSDGTFGPAETGMPGSCRGFQLAGVQDLDGDGIVDLYFVISGPNTSGTATYRGNGDGTFTKADLPSPPPYVPDFNHNLGLPADVDGDGILDAVTREGATVIVHGGKGGRMYEPPVAVYTGCACTLRTFVDTNDDGATDVLLLDSERGTITVLVRPRPTAQAASRAVAPTAVTFSPAPAPLGRTTPVTPLPQPPPRAAGGSVPTTAPALPPLPQPAPPRR